VGFQPHEKARNPGGFGASKLGHNESISKPANVLRKRLSSELLLFFSVHPIQTPSKGTSLAAMSSSSGQLSAAAAADFLI